MLRELTASIEMRAIDSYIGTGYHLLAILKESLYQLHHYAPAYEQEKAEVAAIEDMARRLKYTFSPEEARELEHLRSLADLSMKLSAENEALSRRMAARCRDLFQGTAQVILRHLEGAVENEVLVQNLLQNRDLLDRVYGAGAAERIFLELCRGRDVAGSHGRRAGPQLRAEALRERGRPLAGRRNREAQPLDQDRRVAAPRQGEGEREPQLARVALVVRGLPASRSAGRIQAGRVTPCALMRGSCRARRSARPIASRASTASSTSRTSSSATDGVVPGHGEFAAGERRARLVAELDGEDEGTHAVPQLAGLEAARGASRATRPASTSLKRKLW